MFGFQKGAAAAAKNRGIQRGGLIEGPGTGTSDSIKTKMPVGSYIMPADSTKRIGDQRLAGLGFKPQSQRGRGVVPVNVSDGEYELTPEQVHAIGVKALENIKRATHSPVREARGFKPELFFADGGVVQEERKPLFKSGEAGFRTDAVRQGIADDVSRLVDSGQAARAAGTAIRGGLAYGVAGVADGMHSVGDALSPVANFGRGLLVGAEDQPAVAPKPAAPKVSPVVGSQALPTPGQVAAPIAQDSPVAVDVDRGAEGVAAGGSASDLAGLTITETGVEGVSRVDGLDGAPAMFTDNVDRAMGDVRSTARGFNAKAARQALDGRLNNGSTAAPSIAAGVPQDYRVNLTPGPGGRYQSAAESGYQPGGIVIGSSDPRLTPGNHNFDPLAYRASLRSRERDQRGAADQQGFELQREDIAERRAARIGGIDPNQFRLTAAQAGLAEQQAAQAQQVQQLSEQLAVEADPARRAQLQESLLALQGKTTAQQRPRPLRVRVPTGQTNVDGEPVLQDAIYDPDTGQTTVVRAEDAEAAPAAPAMPRPGEARGGYRFMGGDPADQRAWEKL